MLEKSRLLAVAELIRDQISPAGIDRYCQETGIGHDDFRIIEPQDFGGEIYAVDGSNVVIWDWAAANLNRIRAGYAVYRSCEWQRTVFTYDNLFLADPRAYKDQFDQYLEGIFGLGKLTLKETELERISSYFRELQEYVALAEAVCDARPGDIVLYDGSFALWKAQPFGEALKKIFEDANERDVALLGVSKSCAFTWGQGASRPFMQQTSFAGSRLLPGWPWYISLRGKRIEPRPEGWDGDIFAVRFNGQSDSSFRVDAPSFVAEKIGDILGSLLAHSCSAECRGYPHPLFRAHRDIRITEQEAAAGRMALLDLLSEQGLTVRQLRSLMMDYHDVMEMRGSRVL